MEGTVLGIIGGSGLGDIEGLKNKDWRGVETPFGTPSDELCFGELHGQPVVFLPFGTFNVPNFGTITLALRSYRMYTNKKNPSAVPWK